MFVALCLLVLALSACLFVSSFESRNETRAFIGVSANNTLLIQPPQGGLVFIENFTSHELSSALVRIKTAEAELSSTKADLSSALVRVTGAEGDLSSALVRMHSTDELLFSVLSRISFLESSTTKSPCKS